MSLFLPSVQDDTPRFTKRLRGMVLSMAASKTQIRLPVSASRAKRRLIGDGTYRMPSITSGVASNDDREGISLPSLQSSVSKIQAISSFATLARLIWAREEWRVPPASRPT
jgi:hypothetical protein